MTLIDLIADAGLTGRGGAAFPTARKVADAIRHRADIIVNACDGEIGAAKDAWVVEHHLPALLRGAHAIQAATGGRVRWAAHRGSATAIRLAAAGLDVLSAPSRYVSSEATALISLAGGGLARPLSKRTPSTSGGRDHLGRPIRPTLVINAETLWRTSQLLDGGLEWFRRQGTSEQPGPLLVAVTRTDGRVVVLETAADEAVASLLWRAGEPGHPQHLLVGGLGGSFVENTSDLLWSDAHLARQGATVGPGVLIALDPNDCPLAVVESYLRYAGGESAGQCGPCMFGVPETLTVWQRFAAQPTRRTHDDLLAHCALLDNRGSCRFPDGVASFTRSAARLFAEHALGHTAGACPGVRSPRHAR